MYEGVRDRDQHPGALWQRVCMTVPGSLALCLPLRCERQTGLSLQTPPPRTTQQLSESRLFGYDMPGTRYRSWGLRNYYGGGQYSDSDDDYDDDDWEAADSDDDDDDDDNDKENGQVCDQTSAFFCTRL